MEGGESETARKKGETREEEEEKKAGWGGVGERDQGGEGEKK